MQSYAEQQAKKRADAEADRQMRQYLGTLSPAQRAQYLQSRAQLLSGEEEEPPEPPKAGFGKGFATGAVPMISHGQSGAYHANAIHQQQGKIAQDMMDRTMSAWQDEHDSRVSQLREIRRMEHEKELKRMELEALIARLGAMR